MHDLDASVFATHIPVGAGTIAMYIPLTQFRDLPPHPYVEIWIAGMVGDRRITIETYWIIDGVATLKSWALAGGNGALGARVNSSRDHLLVVGVDEVDHRVDVTFAVVDEYIAELKGPEPDAWVAPDLVGGAATMSVYNQDIVPSDSIILANRDVTIEDSRVNVPGGIASTGRLRVSAEHVADDSPRLFITDFRARPVKSIGSLALEQRADDASDESSWDAAPGDDGISRSYSRTSFGTYSGNYSASFTYDAKIGVLDSLDFWAFSLPVDVAKLNLTVTTKPFDSRWTGCCEAATGAVEASGRLMPIGDSFARSGFVSA